MEHFNKQNIEHLYLKQSRLCVNKLLILLINTTGTTRRARLCVNKLLILLINTTTGTTRRARLCVNKLLILINTTRTTRRVTDVK